MIEALKKIFGKTEKSSSQIASDRLRVVLMHDRANISPDVMEHLKNDIMEVISKYMEFDQQEVEIGLENDQDSVALVANIPVNKMKAKR